MKFILLESANYLNKNHKLHIKFATTLANTRTYGGIEPLKLTIEFNTQKNTSWKNLAFR
jgi:hypothetical protein